MQYTDDEIIQIIVEQKKAKLRRQKRRRRQINLIMLLIVLILFALLAGILIKVTADYISERTGSSGTTSSSSSGASETAAVKNGGVIFLDPGHGGSDPGAQTSARNEKDDTLKIALLTKKALEKKGYTVYMSRTTDKSVDREERGKMANRKKADLFVSIHRNTGDAGSEAAATASGAEVWISSSDPDDSRLLGSEILKELKASGTMSARAVKSGTLPDPNDDYYENEIPTMPSCLVELGFMTDKSDNKAIDNKSKKIAQALATGIDKSYKIIKNDNVSSYQDLLDKYRP